MINDESFDHYQFVLSYELLKLLEWLIDHEQESLKQLVKHAVDQGFLSHGKNRENDPDELQQNIIDFFGLLDSLIHETVNEDEVEDALRRSLIPAINSIDATMYDSTAYSTSVAKATAIAGRKGRNPKEVLCKELLKRWKPHKKSNMH